MHGSLPIQNDRMFDIANVAFDNVSDEEKQAYTTSFEKMGQYLGYKPRKQWVCLLRCSSTTVSYLSG